MCTTVCLVKKVCGRGVLIYRDKEIAKRSSDGLLHNSISMKSFLIVKLKPQI